LSLALDNMANVSESKEIVGEAEKTYTFPNIEEYLEMDIDDNCQLESGDGTSSDISDHYQRGTETGSSDYDDDEFGTKTGLSVWYFRPNKNHPTRDFCNIYLRRTDSTGVNTLFFSIEDLVYVVRELTYLPLKDASLWGGMQSLLPLAYSPTCPTVKYNGKKMCVTMTTSRCLEFNFGLGAVPTLVKKLCLFYSLNISVAIQKKLEAEQIQNEQHLSNLELISTLSSKIERYEQKEKDNAVKIVQVGGGNTKEEPCPTLLKAMLAEVIANNGRMALDDGGRRNMRLARGKAAVWLESSKTVLIPLDTPKTPGDCECQACTYRRCYLSYTAKHEVPAPKITHGFCPKLVEMMYAWPDGNPGECPKMDKIALKRAELWTEAAKSPFTPLDEDIEDEECGCDPCIYLKIFYQYDNGFGYRDPPTGPFTRELKSVPTCKNLHDFLHKRGLRGSRLSSDSFNWCQAGMRAMMPQNKKGCPCAGCNFISNYFRLTQGMEDVRPPNFRPPCLTHCDKFSGFCRNLIDSLYLINSLDTEFETDDFNEFIMEMIKQHADDWIEASKSPLVPLDWNLKGGECNCVPCVYLRSFRKLDGDYLYKEPPTTPPHDEEMPSPPKRLCTVGSIEMEDACVFTDGC